MGSEYILKKYQTKNIVYSLKQIQLWNKQNTSPICLRQLDIIGHYWNPNNAITLMERNRRYSNGELYSQSSQVKKGFNYSYTNLSIIHNPSDLSAQSPLYQSKVSGLFWARAVSGLFRCQFRLFFYVQIETFICQINSRCERKPFGRKVIIFNFRSDINEQKATYTQSSVSIGLVQV